MNQNKTDADSGASLSNVMNYHLTYWGQICNDDLINKATGIADRDFWFASKQERQAFKEKLNAIADLNGVIIMFAEHEGPNALKRTVAKMVMQLPDGREVPFDYDFGYGYDADSAEYMFMDGNYSCDCNKSLFLHSIHPEIPEMDCGDEIILKNFTVALVAVPNGQN